MARDFGGSGVGRHGRGDGCPVRQAATKPVSGVVRAGGGSRRAAPRCSARTRHRRLIHALNPHYRSFTRVHRRHWIIPNRLGLGAKFLSHSKVSACGNIGSRCRAATTAATA